MIRLSPKTQLTPIVEGHLWTVRTQGSFFGIPLGIRSAIVRLAGGGLWIHSPIRLTDEVRTAVDAIGEVAALVAPNLSHHLFIDDWRRAYPTAHCYHADGLANKHPSLASTSPLSTAQAPWQREINQLPVKGLPIIDEWVFFHRATNTLLMTDLCFCINNDERHTQWLAKLLGVHRRPAMSRTMKMMVRNRTALRDSVRELLQWPISRVVICHDAVIEADARSAIERAFAWVLT